MFIANTLQSDLPVVLSFLLVQWFVLAGFCRYFTVLVVFFDTLITTVCQHFQRSCQWQARLLEQLKIMTTSRCRMNTQHLAALLAHHNLHF